jgi:hypothetical protein
VLLLPLSLLSLEAFPPDTIEISEVSVPSTLKKATKIAKFDARSSWGEQTYIAARKTRATIMHGKVYPCNLRGYPEEFSLLLEVLEGASLANKSLMEHLRTLATSTRPACSF